MLIATDWPELLPDVARRLLGEPTRTEHGGDTWRYGTRGSLAVHVGGDRRGTWRDHEADASGGTLALVEHLAQTDKAGALRWLESERLIDARDPARRDPPPSSPAPAKRPSQRSATADLAAGILGASVPADDTPARAYLAARWTWPPLGTGPDLPATVRWIARSDVPLQNGEHGPYNPLPATAAGAVVYLFRRPDVATDPEAAVSLEAVTDAGDLLTPRWRRTYGARTGRVFEARSNPGGAVVLAEGERDALALALIGAGGVVRAVGGTAGYRPEAATDPELRPVVLVPDADHAGAAAVTRLLTADLDGRALRLAPWPAPASGDPAAWLDDWLTERAGIREHDGGMDREAASAAAWTDLQNAVDRGATILIDLEADHD